MFIAARVGLAMRLKLAVCLFLASAFVAAGASADEAKAITAKQMLDACALPNAESDPSSPCKGYLIGAIFDLEFADLAGRRDNPPKPPAYCIPEDIAHDLDATGAAVRVWVRKHPKTWSMPAPDAYDLAMRALWGCAK